MSLRQEAVQKGLQQDAGKTLQQELSSMARALQGWPSTQA